MAPRSGSRFTFCSGIHDDSGILFLTEREPYRYQEHDDTRVHIVVQGDCCVPRISRKIISYLKQDLE